MNLETEQDFRGEKSFSGAGGSVEMGSIRAAVLWEGGEIPPAVCDLHRSGLEGLE